MPARVRTRVFGNVIAFVFRTQRSASPFQPNTQNVLGYRLLGRWMIVVVPDSGLPRLPDLGTLCVNCVTLATEISRPRNSEPPHPLDFYLRGAHANSGDPTKIRNTRYIVSCF